MNFVELIERKRDGNRLTSPEITWLIGEYTAARIPDYQMSALLMAVFKEGLDGEELATWTEAMLHSGEILDFSDIAAPKVDKHSTGGVGDKVSIPLVPMVAACGVAVPMVSGRGLSHTGGTLDKLESIPGFRTALDPPEFRRLLARHGMVLAGQSSTIAPADRSIYALRDSTGTVPSIPLIASSIMSKKLAEGIDALVLDVKVGAGAFMKDLDHARLLAHTMVAIGEAHDTETVAYLTDMNQPLGREIGNATEIAESLAVLRGGGPEDLVEVTYTLGSAMLVMGGITTETVVARAMLEEVIASGAAFDKFVEIVIAQGGDPAVVNDPSRLPAARGEHILTATRAGFVTRCDALDLGIAAMRIGAGRATKEEAVDHGVGITVERKVGDPVDAGDVLARLHWNDEGRLADAIALADLAFEIGDAPVAPHPLIIEEVR